MLKYRMILAPILLALALGISCTHLLAQQRALADKMIRFHVVASSDGVEDQRVKLMVRDALLETLRPMANQAHSREEMAAALQAALPQLQAKAAHTLSSLGSKDGVAVTLQQEDFPTRYYPSFTLPAGQYLCLRVQLGQGQGHNWWCVCFPSLCMSACTQDVQDIAAGAGFSADEVDWITEQDDYVIRFRLLEWLQKLKG